MQCGLDLWRMAPEIRVDFGERSAHCVDNLDVAAAADIGIRRANKFLDHEMVDGGGDAGLTLRLRARHAFTMKAPQAEGESGNERDASNQNPRPSGAATLKALSGKLRTMFGLSQLVALTRTLRAVTQSLAQLADAAEAMAGVAGGGSGDILAQQFIADFPLPTRSERATQIADDHLVEHESQGIEIALHGRRLTAQDLRCNVQSGAAGVGCQCVRNSQSESRDTQPLQALGLEQPTAAEIGDAHARSVGRIAQQYVRRFQVLVQHADAMGGSDRSGNFQEQGDASVLG